MNGGWRRRVLGGRSLPPSRAEKWRKNGSAGASALPLNRTPALDSLAAV